ncbi:hypothetical protein [Krasilnikovia sp. MM14-A1259]|uniref:hypothetical protein n=1 Tax=Krasilnikovia sp. MM14-A1259 TaxID=3373539 RepID=UPI0037F333CD
MTSTAGTWRLTRGSSRDGGPLRHYYPTREHRDLAALRFAEQDSALVFTERLVFGCWRFDGPGADVTRPLAITEPVNLGAYLVHGVEHLYARAVIDPCLVEIGGLRELALRIGGVVTGRPVILPQLRFWPDDGCYMAEFDTDLSCVAVPVRAGQARVTMTVEHAYELYDEVTAYVVDAVIAKPPADEASDAYTDWHQDLMDKFTGVGRPLGDSWYDLTITDSTDPDLIGRTFDWGY